MANNTTSSPLNSGASSARIMFMRLQIHGRWRWCQCYRRTVSTGADVQPTSAATTLHQESYRPAAGESVLILTRVESSVRLDPVGLEWLAATCTSFAREITDTT